MNYIIIVGIILIDQFTKYLTQANMHVNETIPIINNIFHLTYVQNPGAAFGILRNQKWFFVVVTIVVLGGVFIYSIKNKNMHKLMSVSLSLIVAGAIGNFIDRVRLDYVIDYFDFRIWPVFNIADISIVVGAILLSYYLIKYDEDY
ncbi:signal peptidase II [Anaeromicrobium sediminis]|uniref:Lipoprotein signal peptidase n=1 Tax=Anaeromicrobium sediminis TaxID=1478221 RepID=A0A267MH41_9FIRM|nr:signal peptidase II [Anaeromicrobium sediminis]PAB58856.1 signal peptidase II [Anaeromicrobium sediminis]